MTTKELKQKIAEIKNEIGKMEKKKENPYFKSKYFDINQLLENLKPFEEKHKISITQPLTHAGDQPAIALVIDDLESDEQIREVMIMPNLQDPQKMGSAVTYYRRYALVSYFELQAEDNDANHASGKAPIKASEEDIISALERIESAQTEEELNKIAVALPRAVKTNSQVRKAGVDRRLKLKS